ncbi:MAG: hypothetical protein ACOYMZ_03490 [Minisyncoccia bacterium]
MVHKKLILASIFFVILPFFTIELAEYVIIQNPNVYDSLLQSVGIEIAEVLTGLLSSPYTFMFCEAVGLILAITALIQLRHQPEAVHRLIWRVLGIVSLFVSTFFLLGFIYRVFIQI